MIDQSIIDDVHKLDIEYFGTRDNLKLINALSHQIHSMQCDSTPINIEKQIGDILFILISFARNTKYSLSSLLENTVQKLYDRKKSRHYYEAHVTIEPVFDKKLAELSKIANIYGFRVASLLMQKRKKDTAERSKNDSFCTARSISYSDLKDRMMSFMYDIKERGYMVWRYKIESTLLDSRYDDSVFTLDRNNIPQKELNPRPPAQGALGGRLV